MDVRSAIVAFSQSEKIKAGLIWTSQTLEVDMSLTEPEKTGSRRIITVLLNMIANEIHVVAQMAPSERWDAAMTHINKALVMLHSNVAQEAPYHLSKALSQVTSIGHESMSRLAADKLL